MAEIVLSPVTTYSKKQLTEVRAELKKLNTAITDCGLEVKRTCDIKGWKG